MEFNNMIPALDAKANETTATTTKFKKRQGKGSRARNLAKFRERSNAQKEQNRLHDLEKSLKLFETDDTRQLMTTAETTKVTIRKKAIPLSVTTRAIGFSTAIFYDRAATTWNLAAVAQIATIHQIYRVHLWMTHYKLYRAQQIQSELHAYVAFQRIDLSDEMREIIETVGEVPSVISLVLDSIGKIETSRAIYHMGYASEPETPQDLIEYSTLCLHPDRIRQTIVALSNPDTPVAERREFIAYNSIPGAYFVGDLLMNADQIYPAVYGPAEFRVDVSAYKNFLTRVQSRLPKHAILRISWSGKAAMSGLWSGPRTGTRLESTFSSVTSPIESAKRRLRDGRGRAVEVTPPPRGEGMAYTKSRLYGERATYWSKEDTPEAVSVVGIASLVGEECFMFSRYEMDSPFEATGTAITSLYSFSDAPR